NALLPGRQSSRQGLRRDPRRPPTAPVQRDHPPVELATRDPRRPPRRPRPGRLRRRGAGARAGEPARCDPARRRPRRGGRRPVRRRGGGGLDHADRRGPRPARRPRGGMSVDLDLTPSSRPHGAQRMFSATILVIEAFVVFFAALAAHQLVPEDRVLTWSWGLLTLLALVLC